MTSEPPHAGGPTSCAAVTRGGDISGTASGPQRPSCGAGSGTGALTQPRHRFPLPPKLRRSLQGPPFLHTPPAAPSWWAHWAPCSVRGH